ncbi:MAG TPA: potassium channel family protein [Tepidisphaeraceae bacterium]
MAVTQAPASSVEDRLDALEEQAHERTRRLSPEDLAWLAEVSQQTRDEISRLRGSQLLAESYWSFAHKDRDFALRVHHLLMRDLMANSRTLSHPSCSWLVATYLQDDNLPMIPWSNASEVSAAAECFYGFYDTNTTSEAAHRRVRDLVKHAGLNFARAERWGEVYRLLATVQVPPDVIDADLFRLRSALVLYEQKRVVRIRRALSLALVGVLLYLFCVSPIVLVELENPYRSAHQLPVLKWSDGLYWSVMTSTTVGYGDIVPFTPYGRLFAMFTGLLGVLLVGVTAGLILSLLTPRRVD